MKIKVLGVDPALRNFGFAVATVDLETDQIEKVECLELSKTEDDAGKKVRRNSDDLRRARIHADALRKWSDPKEVSIAFIEVPVGSQSARAMASYGICIGVLTNCRCGVIEVTPTEVKVAATGSKTATKEEMIDWAYKKYRDALIARLPEKWQKRLNERAEKQARKREEKRARKAAKKAIKTGENGAEKA